MSDRALDAKVAEQAYSAEEVARLLGVSRSTFYTLAWFKARKVRPLRASCGTSRRTCRCTNRFAGGSSMVFKAAEARTFKVKFAIPTRNGGKPRTFSTGATVKAVAQDVERSDVDLSPLVNEWAKKANAKYVTQVRVLIPATERFPRSQFRKARISKFLAELDVEDSTRTATARRCRSSRSGWSSAK
jgi:hypothetical protein